MLVRGWRYRAARLVAIIAICMLCGCESAMRADESPQPMVKHRAREIATARLAQSTQPSVPPKDVPSRPVQPTETQPAPAVADVAAQIPDPENIANALQTELDRDLQRPGTTEEDKSKKRVELNRLLKNITARTDTIRREKTARLSLNDVIHRSLNSSYAVQVQTYNPAIDTTKVVEAEAQFDAVFFAAFQNNKQDRPSSSQLQGTSTEDRTFDSGIRKLLSTGAQISAQYNLVRSASNLSFQTLNPSYFNQFEIEFKQPLLRGFGLDYNRSQLELRKLDRAISLERLKRTVRETLFHVEEAYWRLVQARRNLTVTARLLSNLETIFNYLKQRLEIGYDVYIVQVKLTESRIETQRSEFVRIQHRVKNAEDTLKQLMNDPELNQAQDIEIIPSNVSAIEPIMLDQLGELTAALTNREELHETKLAIEQAQLAIGVAKNQALPKLDAMFRYFIDGLGPNSDHAFKQMTENRFNEYVVQLELEWPIGNRGPEAALRRARLQQAQAIASHRDQIESVINEVNQAIRDLQSDYDQIGPTFRAAKASQEQLRATVERAERRDPATLQVELDAHEALATQRQQLIQVLASYNIDLINLERVKGTLLKYNNITIRGINEDAYLEPYRPIGP